MYRLCVLFIALVSLLFSCNGECPPEVEILPDTINITVLAKSTGNVLGTDTVITDSNGVRIARDIEVDAEHVLPDHITINVHDERTGQFLGTKQVTTSKNGDKIVASLAASALIDTIAVAHEMPIVDGRYPFVEGLNEAEHLKLIGYEIDGDPQASGDRVVELDSDGGLGTDGEIEGYYVGTARSNVTLQARVWVSKHPVEFSFLHNYKQVFASEISTEEKPRYIIIESQPFALSTPSVLSLRVNSHIAQAAFVDWIALRVRP